MIMTIVGSSDHNNIASVHLCVNAHKVCVFAIFAAINQTQHLPHTKLLKQKRLSESPLQTHMLKIC